MKLAEKLRYLRSVEGSLRGLGRDMTQLEVVRALRKELGAKLSQSYLSQLESGARPHMTNTTRTVLARFFKVHPGYLVDDPKGFHYELTSDLPGVAEKLDLWLIDGSERFRRDLELSNALLRVARHEDSRKGLVVLALILESPELLDRLFQVLQPAKDGHPERKRTAETKEAKPQERRRPAKDFGGGK